MPTLVKQLETLDYDIVKTKKTAYINLPCGFDIETTSVYAGDEQEKAAFMYVWMLGIGHDTPIVYGRTWDELLSATHVLQNHFDTSPDKRLVVYVHNLAYEFQFMRYLFDWHDVFAVAKHKPIRATTTSGIEFRDSYVLSGQSLASTARNLTKHTIEKMEGDLDYSLIRHHNTPLTDEEIGYCDNDIHILTAYVTEEMELAGDIAKIPMTNTQRVRKYVHYECYHGKGKTRKESPDGKKKRYFGLMKKLTLKPDDYIQLRRGFMGGFTHANVNHVGKTLHDVSSIDFTSAYPSVMVSEQFPMSRFVEVEITSMKQLHDLIESNQAIIMDVQFENIRNKITQETYLSASKCLSLTNPDINNGRVDSADELTTTITEVDYLIMKQVYDWDSIAIGTARVSQKGYLPRAIIKSVLDLYQDKTQLKGVAGREQDYMLSKGMLNSIYGMSVTDIVKDDDKYITDWITEPADINEKIDTYNKGRSRFLFYPWGLWVTAYARMNLWTGILAMGDDYIYSDTDSLKVFNYDDHKDYIEAFNEDIIEKMERMCDHYKFDKKLLRPKTKKGHEKILGVWDFEGTYSRFKTLGAKRYMHEEDGEVAITVAGLSKQNGVSYMREQEHSATRSAQDIFNQFDDGLYIPEDRTGKMTHTYIHHELKFEVTDYRGQKEVVNPLSGVHLEPCDFTLSISDEFRDLLNRVSTGYIYQGVEHA